MHVSVSILPNLVLTPGVLAIADFTCITKPRIGINNEATYIAGFFNDRAEVSFSRTINTYTQGDSLSADHVPLPSNDTWYPPLAGSETVAFLRMSANLGKARIGTFACKMTKNGKQAKIDVVIMSRNGMSGKVMKYKLVTQIE